ncbi:rho GTPase-activating protein 39 isoform X2 [Thunnus albacares]|uniref:rho GTPase-activating protein 39 isoform X2 n=1 Tax=Thunnus maccoyii TaxID=8240 RepID=UPI001C4C1783|nr:rho GTPase-activating protein 39 isoform X2 [Thunnus maccoyii]XP_044204583.1 rho GTPase-activating protein 39 isoform X2 [Thunnus albacares]
MTHGQRRRLHIGFTTVGPSRKLLTARTTLCAQKTNLQPDTRETSFSPCLRPVYNVRRMAGTSSDWVEILEPRSRERMYVNLTTGECGWEPPQGAPVRQADGNQWWELFDPQSGRFYYYNSTGRRTVWHRPQGADIVPLSQLQAMKRCSEAKRAGGGVDRHHHGTTGSISSVGSQGRCTPLPERDADSPVPRALETSEVAANPELDPAVDSRSQGDGSSTEHSTDGSKEPQRDASQRWQPAPGSKAAMLVKVNSMSRSQPSPALQQQHLQHSAHGKANTFTLHSSSSKTQGGHLSTNQGYKTAPSGKMAADTRQAHHLRKASNGSFCLVTSESGHPSPLLHRSQTSTPRPVSPQYGCTAPIYDEPVSDCPIYDEPPIDMEVEGAHLYNGQPLSRLTPTHSLQKPRHLQHPGSSHPGSRHRRNPSASDYSPAGLECIKHMVNVDPKQLLSSSPVPTRAPSPTSRQDPVLTQPQPHPQSHAHSLPQARGQLRDREPGTPGPSTLDKKHSWRVLEATVQRAMEARHSRQSSQASQDFPSSTPQATANYQDSGYSTGPSPSLRRKSRRRVGAGGGAGGRPGSVGSSGELCALNERLMAEMREVVSRSNTMREVRAGLDPEMGERGVVPRTRSPANSLRWYGGGGGSAGRCASREDLTGATRSLSRAGNHGNPALTPLEIPGRQKRTYEKVDTLEMSVNSQASLSSPETPGPPSQAGTLELQAQLESRKKGMVDGRTASLGPHRPTNHDNREGGDGAGGRAGGSSYQLSYATLRQPPPPDMGMEDWASKHLNMHTQGLFRRRVSIANMLSWNRGSIKKPMLVTSNRAVRKEACEMFKLVQAYMGDRPSRLDRRHCALLIVTKCWDMPGLRDELYVQLVRQTTGNATPRSLAAGWELMAVSLAFFAPSPKFRCYLEGYIQRHMEPTSDKKLTQFILEQQELKLKKNSKSRKKRKQNTEEEEGLPISTYAKFCHRKLQKVAITGGKKGLRKPTLEEIDHSRRAIVTPSLFGSSLEEVMERQSELFPDRKLPWVQVQLSQYVLALGGAQTEGIFRVPGDIDEVNALKLQVDQWRIPENLSDPNVPASLMKLWYRELEEPLIPMDFYIQCVSNCDDPVAAIAVVQSLPELNRLVLCYFIHFLQVFAQPSNVAITKMDVNNLAMVMAPNCLRCQSDDPRIIFENTRKEMSFLRMLIVHLDTSFIEGVV